MLDTDFEYFTQILFALAENFGCTQLSPMGLNLRFEALREFTLTQISKAATELIRARKKGFMPTTGEMIEVIEQIEGRYPIPNHEEMAEFQAGIVLEFLRRYGRTGYPEFTDTITQHLMSSRWRYNSWASTVEESELVWWKKDFIRAYKAYSTNTSNIGGFIPLQGAIKQLVGKIGKRL